MTTPSLTETMPWLHQQTTRILMERLATMEHKTAEKLGVSREFIGEIQRMKYGEFNEFVNHFAMEHLTISLDLDELQSTLIKKTTEMQLIAELLSHGASHPQIQAWFGLPVSKVVKLKYLYNASNNSGDCSDIPRSKQNTAQLIFKDFSRIFQDSAHAEPLALLETAKKTDYSIAQLTKLLVKRSRTEKSDV
ncbi:DUF2857 family protein [Salmonella enterica subsp. enterica serovar Manhattan]|nr:DUF2857 family protein [Salmonella enterica subsp. enterica serovar Manhattan]